MSTQSSGAEPVSERPHEPTRRRTLIPSSPADWVLVVIGLVVFGYGTWRVLDQRAGLIGFGAMALGLIILPYRVAGFIGGAGLIALGVRECVTFSTVTLIGGLAMVFGALTIADRIRRA